MKGKETAIAILKEYFGYKPGETLKEFHREIQALSSAEKDDLVQLAAKELGVEILEDVQVASAAR